MSHAAPESARDIAEVPALEIVSTAALHLMSAAAVNLGLAEDLPEHQDLDEARTLIEALAGLVTAGAPRLGHHHAAPLRDGLRTLQLAFREASEIPDAAGRGSRGEAHRSGLAHAQAGAGPLTRVSVHPSASAARSSPSTTNSTGPATSTTSASAPS